MTDWSRKHIFELARACKLCSEDLSLAIDQKKSFSDAFALAKIASTLPNAGGPDNVSRTILMACEACQDSFHFGCTGRYSWKQFCQLIANHD